MIDITDFQEFLSFLDSFKRNKRFYKTISTISKTTESPPRILVQSSEKIFSGDYFCKKCGSNQGSQHSSVDGLYYICTEEEPFTLILIEFKFINNNILANTNHMDEFRTKIKLNLKLKSLETIFCVLPHLIEKYCNGFNEDILKEQLIKSPKIYMFVTDFEFNNKTKARRYQADYFDLERLSPHPFDYIHTLTVKEFETFLNDWTI